MTGQPVCAPLQHASWVWGLAFSPDNKRLLTGSHDRSAVIRDAADGKKLLTLAGADEPVTDVAFLKDGAIAAAWTQSGRARLWGAVDGDPLTPWVETGDRTARISHPERLLLAAGDGQVVNLYEFASPSASPDMLIRMAGLVAGREPADNFTGTSIPAEAIIKAHGQLRREYPESFQVPTAVLTRWHEHEALERPSLARLESSLYHLDRLSQLEPTNSALRENRARLAGLRIPARAPGTSARLLDLTGCYTEAFGRYRATGFAELPRGVQRLGGIEFDLRGLILLRHTETPPGSQPVGDRVSYIRVQQRCARLHFLQGLSSSAPEGVEVARWIMHYADGSQRVWPVRYAEHLREWVIPDSKPKEASRATLAWHRRGEPTHRNATLCLYDASWENPQPDVEIAHLEFQMGDSAPQPFVLAITAE